MSKLAKTLERFIANEVPTLNRESLAVWLAVFACNQYCDCHWCIGQPVGSLSETAVRSAVADLERRGLLWVQEYDGDTLLEVMESTHWPEVKARDERNAAVGNAWLNELEAV